MYKSPIINLKSCIKKMQFPLQLRMDQRKVTSFWQTPGLLNPLQTHERFANPRFATLTEFSYWTPVNASK